MPPPSVLQRLVDLDYCTWRYKGDPDGAWHLGPMAQDFREAFGLGGFDPDVGGGWDYIGVVDHLGVHGVAIQQLHRMLADAAARGNDLESGLTAMEGAAPQ